MAAAKQPVNVPILDYDGRTMPPVWVAYFDALTAEIAALKARLAAAGIP